MEDLARLKKLKLTGHLLPEQTLNNILPATFLISISLSFDYMSEGTSIHVTRWCDYIGKKYTDITDLIMEGSYHPMEIIGQDNFINLLDHISDLANFEVQLRPLTDSIMDAMDTRYIKLRKIELWIEHDNLGYEFQLLKSHTTTRHLQALSITIEHTFSILNEVLYCRELSQLVQTLTYLVDLEIIFYCADPYLLCCVMQNLPSLNTLNFSLKHMTQYNLKSDHVPLKT